MTQAVYWFSLKERLEGIIVLEGWTASFCSQKTDLSSYPGGSRFPGHAHFNQVHFLMWMIRTVVTKFMMLTLLKKKKGFSLWFYTLSILESCSEIKYNWRLNYKFVPSILQQEIEWHQNLHQAHALPLKKEM